MALGDDQGVPGRDREAIPYDQPQRAGVNHASLRQATEWARLHLDVTIALGARHSARASDGRANPACV